jgi:hypothetical protein
VRCTSCGQSNPPQAHLCQRCRQKLEQPVPLTASKSNASSSTSDILMKVHSTPRTSLSKDEAHVFELIDGVKTLSQLCTLSGYVDAVFYKAINGLLAKAEVKSKPIQGAATSTIVGQKAKSYDENSSPAATKLSLPQRNTSHASMVGSEWMVPLSEEDPSSKHRLELTSHPEATIAIPATPSGFVPPQLPGISQKITTDSKQTTSTNLSHHSKNHTHASSSREKKHNQPLESTMAIAPSPSHKDIQKGDQVIHRFPHEEISLVAALETAQPNESTMALPTAPISSITARASNHVSSTVLPSLPSLPAISKSTRPLIPAEFERKDIINEIPKATQTRMAQSTISVSASQKKQDSFSPLASRSYSTSPVIASETSTRPRHVSSPVTTPPPLPQDASKAFVPSSLDEDFVYESAAELIPAFDDVSVSQKNPLALNKPTQHISHRTAPSISQIRQRRAIKPAGKRVIPTQAEEELRREIDSLRARRKRHDDRQQTAVPKKIGIHDQHTSYIPPAPHRYSEEEDDAGEFDVHAAATGMAPTLPSEHNSPIHNVQESRKLLQQATLSAEQGRFDLAAVLLRQALQLTPTESVIHNRLGVILGTKLGRLEEALIHLRTAMDLAPEQILYKSNHQLLMKLLVSQYEDE